MHATGQNIKAGQAFSIKERQTPPIHCPDQYVVPETRVPNTIQARVANARGPSPTIEKDHVISYPSEKQKGLHTKQDRT